MPDEYLNAGSFFQAGQHRAQKRPAAKQGDQFLSLRRITELWLAEHVLEPRMPDWVALVIMLRNAVAIWSSAARVSPVVSAVRAETSSAVSPRKDEARLSANGERVCLVCVLGEWTITWRTAPSVVTRMTSPSRGCSETSSMCRRRGDCGIGAETSETLPAARQRCRGELDPLLQLQLELAELMKNGQLLAGRELSRPSDRDKVAISLIGRNPAA